MHEEKSNDHIYVVLHIFLRNLEDKSYRSLEEVQLKREWNLVWTDPIKLVVSGRFRELADHSFHFGRNNKHTL